jgi:hypothetical protein
VLRSTLSDPSWMKPPPEIFRQMPFGINNLDCDLEISVVSIRKIITKGFQMISYENVSLSLNV